MKYAGEYFSHYACFKPMCKVFLVFHFYSCEVNSMKLKVEGRARIKILALVCAVSLLPTVFRLINNRQANISATRMVIDVAGRRVLIPEHVERIACLTGASYEKAFLVGAGNRIAMRASSGPPWMVRTNPSVQQIPLMHNSHNPNVEDLLKQNVQVVFFWDSPRGLDKLARSGMVAVIPQPERIVSTSIRDFNEKMKSEVRLYGKVLGGDASRKADIWSSYYDQKTHYVMERTQRIPEASRLKVYYLRGPSSLNTLGNNENITWYGEMAGANMVIRNSRTNNIAKVSIEEILQWNPDVVFVGRQYSPDLVLKDAKWRDISAIRNRRVYVIPDGVFYWDSSSEGVLLTEYMAQKLYPDLFKDLKMKDEVQTYYKQFYHYELTDNEADNMLHGLGPDGQRKNHFNN